MKAAYTLTNDLAADTRAALAMLDAGSAGGTGARPVFTRAGLLAEVATDDTGSAAIVTLPVDRLLHLLALEAEWRKPKGEDDSVPVYPPRQVAQSLRAATHWPGLPPLRSIVSHPWVRCDGPHAGDIVATPGYDAESQTWGAWLPELGAEVADLSGEMAPGDALDALADMLHDFPFVDGLEGPHYAAALAGWLTAAARPGIPGNVPLWLVDASTPGSGKGKLTDVVMLSTYGRQTSRTSWPGQDDEVEKRMLAFAMAGVDRVIIDNIKGPLGGPSFDAALTAAASGYQGRILGATRLASVPLRPFWAANGNNVSTAGDLDRRILSLRLDPRTPNPELRKGFRHADIEGTALRRRPQLLAAALRLVRHGLANPGPSLGSFELWSRTVRGSLLSLGLPDPWSAGAELRDRHTDDTHAAIVWNWHTAWGPGDITVPGIMSDLEHVAPHDHNAPPRLLLRESFGEVAADRNRQKALSGRRLGSWLTRHRDLVVPCPDGVNRAIRAPVDDSGKRKRTNAGTVWTVEAVEEGA